MPLISRTLTRTVTLAAALVAASTFAHAGRPLVTEDAGVLGKGECEWESMLGNAKSGGASADVWTTQVGCGGLIPNSQIAVGYGEARGSGITAKMTGINGKTGLWKQGDSAMTLAWGYSHTSVTGGSGNSLFLNAVFSTALNDKLTLDANLGWTRDKSGATSDSYTNANIGLGYNLGGGLEVLGEVYTSDGESAYGMGLRYAASKNVSLNVGYLIENPSPKTKTWSVGLKVAF